MTLVTRFYVGAVIVGGAAALGAQLPRDIAQPLLVLTLTAAMLVASLFKLRLPLLHGPATMSMAYVIDFMVLVTLGAPWAMLIAAGGVIVQCLVRVRRRQPWYRTAFSAATVVLSVQSAAWTWSALGGTIAQPGLATTLLPLTAAGLLYFAVNSGLVGGAIALSARVSPLRLWARSFARTAPGYLAGAVSVAALHMLVTAGVFVELPLIASPMLACHLAYAAWIRRTAERAGPSPLLT